MTMIRPGIKIDAEANTIEFTANGMVLTIDALAEIVTEARKEQVASLINRLEGAIEEQSMSDAEKRSE